MHSNDTTLANGLRLLCHEPFNAETLLDRHQGTLTPNAAFYKRNHFAIPQLDRQGWRLHVGGEVEHQRQFTYDDLLALPRHTLPATLECAGNGRNQLQPQAEGEQWGYGAVSAAEWTGARLRDVLAAAGVKPTAREIVFVGADTGYKEAAGGTIAFERSLPVEQALHPDTLVAYQMNDETLPTEHGFPARLIVPGWYGMASVKWLTRIEASAAPFDGYFQARQYVLRRPEDDAVGALGTPLTVTRPRALFVSPTDGAALATGWHTLRGLAWSGVTPISRVNVSVDGGASWHTATLHDVGSAPAYVWREWEYSWDAATSGPAMLLCVVHDEAGNTQPAEPEWNRLGYANNAIQRVAVTVG
ncbi:MAG TPA: sulfite oxidase [Ktedonobacterales bacterium]|nr:sulfite oxidase [Ktedonobacterales bacterium]